MSQGSGYGYGGSPVGIGAMLGQRINPLLGGPGTALNINQSGGGAGMSGAQLPSDSGGGAGVNPALAGGLLGMIGQQQQEQKPESVGMKPGEVAAQINALQPGTNMADLAGQGGINPYGTGLQSVLGTDMMNSLLAARGYGGGM